MEDIIAYLFIVMFAVYGLVFQRFWLDPWGKISFLNAIKKNNCMVEFHTRSKRIEFYVADYSRAEWSHNNKTYALSLATAYYKGNVPIVKIYEDNAIPNDPFETAMKEELGITCAKCGNISTVTVPIKVGLSPSLLASYLVDLWALIRAEFNSKHFLLIMTAAVLSGICLLGILWLANVSAVNTAAACDASIRNYVSSLNSSWAAELTRNALPPGVVIK